MVSSRRNDGTITQELRYPFAGTAVQFRQESSTIVSGYSLVPAPPARMMPFIICLFSVQ